jgi:carboxyl-terminal processing protease
LIDEGTASMGEIFASAMREHGQARLFGNRTSGNVAAAQVYPLSDGSALQVTILEIYSGNGTLLNRVGVAPDVFLASSPDEIDRGRDIPLEAAVLYCWSASDKQQTAGGTS